MVNFFSGFLSYLNDSDEDGGGADVNDLTNEDRVFIRMGQQLEFLNEEYTATPDNYGWWDGTQHFPEHP